LLPALSLLLKEPLEVQELRSDNFILQMSEPALVERVYLKSEKLPLVGSELRNPGLLVEL
jgi:hypothetical protein